MYSSDRTHYFYEPTRAAPDSPHVIDDTTSLYNAQRDHTNR